MKNLKQRGCFDRPIYIPRQALVLLAHSTVPIKRMRSVVVPCSEGSAYQRGDVFVLSIESYKLGPSP